MNEVDLFIGVGLTNLLILFVVGVLDKFDKTIVSVILINILLIGLLII